LSLSECQCNAGHGMSYPIVIATIRHATFPANVIHVICKIGKATFNNFWFFETFKHQEVNAFMCTKEANEFTSLKLRVWNAILLELVLLLNNMGIRIIYYY
jgi:hypothetical protein